VEFGAAGGGVSILTVCSWASVASIRSVTFKPSSAALVGGFAWEDHCFGDKTDTFCRFCHRNSDHGVPSSAQSLCLAVRGSASLALRIQAIFNVGVS